MASETYSDIVYNNLEVNNLICDYQKLYFTKNIIKITNQNNNFNITNLNSNSLFIIDYQDGIVNIFLDDNLKNGININFYFKSRLLQFNIINNNNLYLFNGSYILINNDIIGKSILKNSIQNKNKFAIKYDDYSIIDINNSYLNLLLNKNVFLVHGIINNKIIFKVSYDIINNIILINDNKLPQLNLNQSYSYEFDISDISMKNINFQLFENNNNNFYNKNIIKIGQEGNINSKYIIDIPLNLLNFNTNYPTKLKYGLSKNIIILDSDFTIGNWETINQNNFTSIPQKYLNQIDKQDINILQWKILNNNEIKFNFNNQTNILTYFKFFYKNQDSIINNYNKIQNIILYGSNLSDYSNIFEIYNQNYTINIVSNQDYLEVSFNNNIPYKYYKFVLNAFTSFSINIYGFQVGTDYSNTNKGLININNKHSDILYFQ
tara:strand:- start:2161 stop:3462 length:1302 start_codon:yes stop_codon:yes gene_type:complete